MQVAVGMDKDHRPFLLAAQLLERQDRPPQRRQLAPKGAECPWR